LERVVDVALGGGAHYFADKLLEAHKDVLVARDRASLAAAAPTGPLLGIFDAQHVPYVLDRKDTVPSLPDMTKAALARVGANPKGFVMQIEGGRVDHAAHSNDAASLIAEQLDFDAAIGTVLDFVKGRDDTLVILTTDHGNANPGLTLYGEAGKKAFDKIVKAKQSFDWIEEQFAGASKAGSLNAKVAEIVEAATGVGLDEKERAILTPMLSARPPREMPFANANKWTSVLGAILADHFGVAFLSPNHTSDLVEVTALGPGSERLQPMIENTDLHGLVCGALALAEPTLLPGMDKVIAPAAKPTDD
jgi:alkaline phosphatase